jgi:hypothetical protein
MKGSPKLERAIDRFECAAGALYDLGSVPLFGQDREEQAAIDRHRRGVKTEYARARTALVKIAEGGLNEAVQQD